MLCWRQKKGSGYFPLTATAISRSRSASSRTNTTVVKRTPLCRHHRRYCHSSTGTRTRRPPPPPPRTRYGTRKCTLEDGESQNPNLLLFSCQTRRRRLNSQHRRYNIDGGDDWVHSELSPTLVGPKPPPLTLTRSHVHFLTNKIRPNTFFLSPTLILIPPTPSFGVRFSVARIGDFGVDGIGTTTSVQRVCVLCTAAACDVCTAPFWGCAVHHQQGAML